MDSESSVSFKKKFFLIIIIITTIYLFITSIITQLFSRMERRDLRKEGSVHIQSRWCSWVKNGFIDCKQWSHGVLVIWLPRQPIHTSWCMNTLIHRGPGCLATWTQRSHGPNGQSLWMRGSTGEQRDYPPPPHTHTPPLILICHNTAVISEKTHHVRHDLCITAVIHLIMSWEMNHSAIKAFIKLSKDFAFGARQKLFDL